MEAIGVLMTSPMYGYLENELETHFNLFRLWQQPSKPEFLKTHKHKIRAVVCNTKIGVDAELIDALPELEIVATFSVGYDNIDLKMCKEKGIRVSNTPDVLTEDVADLAIGLTLGVLRKICACDVFVRNGNRRNGDSELTTTFSGKSVGIVGLGKIGTAIAKRAEAFSCSISYFSRTQKPFKNYKYFSNILDLARHCEILVVACALTEETRHVINRDVLDALGPKGILINVGRGAIVDELEIVSALLEGRLTGAGLDVFENEPEVPKELFSLDNVFLQPHVGTNTMETSIEMSDLVIANLEAHFRNKPLLTPVL